jgi:hypothetical protein
MARILIALALLLAACGDEATSSSQTVETTVLLPPSDPSSTSSTSVPSSGEGDAPAAYIDAVVADAAERAGVSADEVEVLDARSVEWPDGSLGCPQPGMLYAQVITFGYQIVVAAAGETFDYRLGGRGNFRLCETPVPNLRDPGTTLPDG